MQSLLTEIRFVVDGAIGSAMLKDIRRKEESNSDKTIRISCCVLNCFEGI